MILTWWPAPAKLNLMLRIVGRRADGYHELQTVFQLLDYGDRLAFGIRTDGLIQKCTPLPGVPLNQGLAVRAARLLQKVTGSSLGVDIYLDKRLPIGGGLGGGSSDAATTLVVLNHLWNTGLSEDELAELGRKLGADVPVFVRGQSAWAEGAGERLTPLALPESWYAVLCPPLHISTAELFADPKLERNMPRISLEDFLQGIGGNAFEPVALSRYPQLSLAFTHFKPWGQAQLTGTGACVYCAFPDRASAQNALQNLPAGWSGFFARGVNRSPLHVQLEQTTQPG